MLIINILRKRKNCNELESSIGNQAYIYSFQRGKVLMKMLVSIIYFKGKISIMCIRSELHTSKTDPYLIKSI